MKNLAQISLLILILFISCNKEDKVDLLKKEFISGFVQKGPFISGTSITINELENDLSQTGKSFNTQITDNKGSFEINNIELVSNFISIRADGFYYNEVLGEQSSSQITLYAISDISDKSAINVNLLSHLEKSRVEYLISQGESFSDAKNQSQTEILAIFNFALDSIDYSEQLDITKEGNGNAILLAVSLILQGQRTEGELTELLSNISSDLKEDGVVDDSSLKTQLINHAVYLDTTDIRNNLEERYSAIGLSVQIPDFEKYLAQFIDSSGYTFTNYISYPTEGKWGTNILNSSDTLFVAGNYYSMAADLPSGTSLTVKHNGNYDGALGYVIGQDNTGWDDLGPDETMVWRTFKTNRTGEVDIKMFFTDDVTIYIYENDSENPTRIKNLYKSE
jgi:hypothetical protein